MTLPIGFESFCLANDGANRRIIPFPGPYAPKDAEPRRPKILVVDDEQLIARTVAEILTRAGFEAISVYDGPSALELIESFKPDYVLSDVLMPRMNGVELAITISRLCPTVKILLFSGQAGIADILESGAERGYTFDLIAKPIHPLALIQRIREM